MSDILISVSTLEALNVALKRILVELDSVGPSTGRLQEAIDRPAGRSELRERTREIVSIPAGAVHYRKDIGVSPEASSVGGLRYLLRMVSSV